jgi:hypothetical protein
MCSCPGGGRACLRPLFLPRPLRSCPPLAESAVSRLAKRPSGLGLDLADSAETIEQRGGRSTTEVYTSRWLTDHDRCDCHRRSTWVNVPVRALGHAFVPRISRATPPGRRTPAPSRVLLVAAIPLGRSRLGWPAHGSAVTSRELPLFRVPSGADLDQAHCATQQRAPGLPAGHCLASRACAVHRSVPLDFARQSELAL